jgi:hypothetical protein
MKIVYCKALQNIIISKKEKGDDFEEEFLKYEAIVETEKFSKEFQDFINEIKSDNNNSNNEDKEKSDTKNLKESKIISEGIIKEYLAKLKLMNNNQIERELELDILTQVENYNNELQKLQKKKLFFQNGWKKINIILKTINFEEMCLLF